MKIAKEKRNSNIVEYILYMFQVEDTIRAFKFNLQQIESHMISPLNATDEVRKETLSWYSNLLLMMEKEQLHSSGHLQFLRNLIDHLNAFHIAVLSHEIDANYQHTFRQASIVLTELSAKSPVHLHDVELGFNALYGYMLLKLKRADISDETTAAIKTISQWMGNLASLFLEFERGNLEL